MHEFHISNLVPGSLAVMLTAGQAASGDECPVQQQDHMQHGMPTLRNMPMGHMPLHGVPVPRRKEGASAAARVCVQHMLTVLFQRTAGSMTNPLLQASPPQLYCTAAQLQLLSAMQLRSGFRKASLRPAACAMPVTTGRICPPPPPCPCPLLVDPQSTTQRPRRAGCLEPSDTISAGSTWQALGQGLPRIWGSPLLHTMVTASPAAAGAGGGGCCTRAACGGRRSRDLVPKSLKNFERGVSDQWTPGAAD
jgi:hypothetical protein